MIKFIFIFFFKAAYEPQFIFELTPLYLLSGFSNMQLVLLSLLVILLDMVLHLQASKRNLLLSFLPTVLMLSSMAFTIMFNPIEITYALHYVYFGCLLLVVLIDYQYLLKGVQAPTLFRKKEPVAAYNAEPAPPRPRRTPLFTKKATRSPEPPATLIPENVADFQRASETIVQRIHTVLDDLEQKTVRIEQLEKTLEQQQPPLAHQTPPYPMQGSSPLPSPRQGPVKQENIIRSLSEEERIVLKERIENHLIIDDMDHIVAVIQRGVFKEISHSFADFLGYECTELLQKNFFVFIAPSGFDDARKYYLNRLKGITTNSFKTVLLTKAHTELPVEITVAPTVYKGDSAEFLSIKEIKT